MAALLGAVAGAFVSDGDDKGAYATLLDTVPFDHLMSSVLQGEWAAGGREAPLRVNVAAPTGAAIARQCSASALRCLDATHTAHCDVCLPAPLEGEEGARAGGGGRAAGRQACARQALAAVVGAAAAPRAAAAHARAAPPERCMSWRATRG
jgi:hypothetical protein